MESTDNDQASLIAVRYLARLLYYHSQLEHAIKMLSRFKGPEVGMIIWNTPGAINKLLNELDWFVKRVGLNRLGSCQARKISRIFTIFEQVISHPGLRTPFLTNNIPCHLLPFITTYGNDGCVENMCKASLCFFLHFLDIHYDEVIVYLLGSDFLHRTLQVLNGGVLRVKENALSALLIYLKDTRGFTFICGSFGMLRMVADGLANATVLLQGVNSYDMVSTVIFCYMQLAQNEYARGLLRQALPEVMKRKDLRTNLTNDEALLRSMELLVAQIYVPPLFLR